MLKGKKYCLLLLWIGTCWFAALNAQPVILDTSVSTYLPPIIKNEQPGPVATGRESARPFEVGEIVIEGNKRTKPWIVLRELPFKSGDSINLPELISGFETGRQQLMNTRLFNEVVVALKSFRGHIVDVVVQVKERWYIFPIPYVKPVDRNLAEWAKQGYGTDRLNYGFKFTHYNFTGRNDKLRLWLITGYTRQVEFQYEQPFADKSLKHGYRVGFSYGSNREVNYGTVKNQQQFVDTFSGIKRWQGNLEYMYRPGLRTFHSLRFGYHQQELDPMIAELNPNYFLGGRTKVAFPELAYSISHVHVDYIPYPLTGWMGEASLMKRGLNSSMNMWQLNARLTRSWPVAKKLYYHLQSNGIFRYPFEQPFMNSQMFGYGDMYLRGLENYVVDGVAGLLFRHTLRRELFRFNIPTFLKSTSHDRIPFRIYAKTYADVGYAKNRVFAENSLTNRMMYTTGFGLDVVTFYDFVMRFDYSFNQFGQNGLFLHLKNEF